PLPAPLDDPDAYYASVTLHGTAMAYVVTTFFAMGFGYVVTATSLGRPVRGVAAAWICFVICLIGTLMAVAAVLAGHASVLYTFYPPLLASSWYYGGAFLLIGGSMIWVVLMIYNMTSWKRDNPGQPVPLAMFAITATAILWAWAASGVLVELVGILLPSVSRPHDGNRRGTGAHIVLGNAARHRLFLVDAGIHRVLHDAPPGGRRSTLQRHHGPAHVHHVYHILGASRNASPLRRSGAWRGNEVFAVVPDLLCRPADAADGLLDLRQPGNSRTCTRRKRPPGLDSGIAVGRANGARNRAVAGDARPRRIRRAHQHGLRHELHDSQYLMGDGAFPYDFRRRRRDHVFRYRLRDVAAHHGKAAAVQGLGALAALAVVRRHDDRLDPMAHHWLDGPAASRRSVRLRRSVRRSHGPAGHHFGYWRRDPARVCHSTDRHSGALSVGRKTARGTAALCPRGKSAQNGPRSLERLRAVERDPARPDGVRLRISHWSVLYSEIESSRLRSVRPHEQRGGR